ncbi:MAG: GNAT family N-acetyltransferase [Clostridia bacterium]|nr:GNAT family N-acetyltransferase [Clostridia bacterium]
MGKRLIQAVGAEALQSAAPLFANWQETMVWSALEGGMGRIWTIEERPKAALCENADFLFLAGSAEEMETRLLLEAWRNERAGQFIILVPDDPRCADMIRELFGEEAKRWVRYAFQKGGECFNREKLEGFVKQLPLEFTLRPFDEALYHEALKYEWSRDFCSQFENAQDFLTRGTGVAALRNGELIGGASSYAVYSRGIEIQIQTREDCQKRGVATACGAQLILRCLDKNLYPSWDAANEESVRLAKKFGYIEAGPYDSWGLY